MTSSFKPISIISVSSCFCAFAYQLDLFKIEKYFQRSEIVKKLHGFYEKAHQEVVIHEEEDDDPLLEKHRPALGVVESFFLALSNADKDGRIIVSHNGT